MKQEAKHKWEGYSVKKKYHFIYDHKDKFKGVTEKAKDLVDLDYNDLPQGVKDAFEEHLGMPVYKAGGGIKDKFADTITDVSKIPNLEEKIKNGKVSYRGLGVGKLADDFYNQFKQNGSKIKIDGKEFFITDSEFDKISKGEGGKMRIPFDAPQRKMENGGNVIEWGTYFVNSNQYIPYKSSVGKTYYYVVDIDNNIINKNTGKKYKGKEMNNYKFETKKQAQEFADKLNKPKMENGGNVRRSNLRSVRVTFSDGSVMPTSMAAHLTDDEIKEYYKIGKTFNVGEGGKDKMAKVTSVEILDNKKPMNELELTEDEGQFICDCINRYGTSEHPQAELKTLASFKKSYIKDCIMAAKKEALSEHGATMLESCKGKLGC